jgi:hypothetical protein
LSHFPTDPPSMSPRLAQYTTVAVPRERY